MPLENIQKEIEEIFFEEEVYGKKVKITYDGKFVIDGSVREWYKDAKTQKYWFPKKRKSTLGLVKQFIND